jgi:hypothetical protein
MALNYPNELLNSPVGLTNIILEDVKPFLDRDLNWRVFPRYLAKFVENGITVDQVGKLSDFRNLYGSKNLSEEMILNLLVNKVSKKELDQEQGNVSLAIARRNENKFHDLFEDYCKTNNLTYNKVQVENFVYKELGITKTPSLKDYKSNTLLGYSTIDGEAVFSSVKNLMELNRIKKITDDKEREIQTNNFFKNLMVFCMADKDAAAQKVFEGGSGLNQLARANNEGQIKLIAFKINPNSDISPQNQIPSLLNNLTSNGNAKLKTFTIAAHGSPINMSLVVPYKGNSRTLKNEGSLSYDDAELYKQIGSCMDKNNGIIYLQSCDTAGPQGANPFGYPENNIADFIAVNSGVNVIAPAPSIRNGSYSVVRNQNGEYVPVSNNGLCTYLISPQLDKQQNPTRRVGPVVEFFRELFGRN